MEKKDETIPGQMSILDLIEEEPQSFEDYIGKCRFCMWNGYGLYDPYGKRRKDAGSYNCQCDDAISRQEVLDEIDKRFDLAKPFKQLIKSMPPVTPQQKMGRWAVLKDEYGDVIEDVCSNCDKNGNRKWAFCPFCGCKMQEVEND